MGLAGGRGLCYLFTMFHFFSGPVARPRGRGFFFPDANRLANGAAEDLDADARGEELEWLGR